MALPVSGIRTGIRLGIREIGANLRRSVLSLLSICLGIATVLVLNSLTGGAKKESMRQLERMGGVSILTVSATEPSTPEEEAKFARSEGLNYGEMRAFVQNAECCDALLPEGRYSERTIQGPRGPKRGHAQAINWLSFQQSNIPAGNWISPVDRLAESWEKGDEVTVLGDMMAEELFGSPSAALGQTIEYGKVNFRVVGLVTSASRLDWRRRICYYPYAAYLHHFSTPREKLESIQVRMRAGYSFDLALREIRGYLMRRHRGVLDFSVQTAEEEAAENAKAAQALSILGWAIALMAIGVGGVGILNLMLATVSGRLREIGVRMALGANGASILAQFLAESVMVAGLGTLAGLLIGGSPTWFLGSLLPIQPTLSAGDYLLALALGWGTGLFAGIYPAIKASQLSPVEALRG